MKYIFLVKDPIFIKFLVVNVFVLLGELQVSSPLFFAPKIHLMISYPKILIV